MTCYYPKTLRKNQFHFIAGFLFFAIILIGTKLHAQNDLLLYNMSSIPQSNNMNPALMPDCNRNSGLLLSSFAINLHQFPYVLSDIPQHDDHPALNLDLNKVFENSHKWNTQEARGQWEYFRYGERKRNSYFNLTFTTKSFLYSEYSKEFANLVRNGNPIISSPKTQVGSYWSNYSMYQEIAFAYAYRFKNKLNIGIRPKVLMGITNLSSDRTTIGLSPDSTGHQSVLSSPLVVHSTALDLFPTNNVGFAFDFGMNYDINQRVSVSFSASDLGFIRWSQGVTNLNDQGMGNKVFNSIPLSNLVAGNYDKFKVGKMIDTLKTAYGSATDTTQAYTNQLINRYYLSGKYQLDAFDDVTALYRGEWFNNRMHSSYSFAFNRYFSRILSLSANYSILERSYFNIGLGGSVNIHQVQFYFVTDNLPGLLAHSKPNDFTFRAGLAFTFGRIARTPFVNKDSNKL